MPEGIAPLRHHEALARHPGPPTEEMRSVANKEHLEILQQGARTWNAWRHVHPGVQPDLSGADLGGA